MILTTTGLCRSFGGDEILREVKVTVNEGDRIGIVGENGAGKSTLLRLLIGELEGDKGSVQLTKGKRIGVLHQDSGLDRNGTLRSEMERAYPDLMALKAKIQASEQAGETGAAYADLLAKFAQAGGYDMDVEIEKVLNGMGFLSTDRNTLVSTLSGGQKTRLAFCKLLCAQPDLLILDEPTNHLDLATLTWLEDYLAGWKHALLIVSHDRYFLDGVANHIWEVEDGQVTGYKGNYSAYVRQKEEHTVRQEKEYQLQQEEIQKMETYIEKNLARASTAKSAKSRMAALERMERIEKPKTQAKLPPIRFTYDREPVKDVLTVDHLALSVGGKRLCREDICLHVEKGEKLGIIGVNGAGKSTLLKTLNGLQPDGGCIHWGDYVRLGYYDQEHLSLDPENTVLEEVWSRYPRLSQQQVRGCLGSLQIIGEDVFKKVGTLSGGERAKLLFAILTLLHPNVLLLDEPTNHLDLRTRSRLEEALMAYTGTVICVSHDRYFLNRMPDSIGELTAEGLTVYPGKYDDYTSAVSGKREKPEAPKAAASAKAYGKQRRQQEAKLRAEISRVESRLAEIDEEINRLEQEMGLACADHEQLAVICAALETAKKEQDGLLEKWVELNP